MEAASEQEDDDDMRDVDDKVLNRALVVLSEQFETVQIFVTKQSNGEIQDRATGSGNFLARKGQVHEWTVRQDEMQRQYVRRLESE